MEEEGQEGVLLLLLLLLPAGARSWREEGNCIQIQTHLSSSDGVLVSMDVDWRYEWGSLRGFGFLIELLLDCAWESDGWFDVEEGVERRNEQGNPSLILGVLCSEASQLVLFLELNRTRCIQGHQ